MSKLLILLLTSSATAALGQANAAAGLPSPSGGPERVCLREILIRNSHPEDPSQVAKAQQRAEELLALIRGGEKFEDVAHKYSDSRSAAVGGLLALKREQLQKEIADKIFAMQTEDVSDPIHTRKGFVILEALDWAKIVGAHATFGATGILSDTQGIDFGPYLEGFVQEVRTRWYGLISPSASGEHGTLMVQVRILKDGQLDRVRIVASSGQGDLDRPSLDAVTAAAPFPPLPAAFTGGYIDVRFRFIYNWRTDRPASEEESIPLSW